MNKEVLFPGFNSYKDTLDIDRLNVLLNKIKDDDYRFRSTSPRSFETEKNSELSIFLSNELKPYINDYFKDYNTYMENDRGFVVLKYSKNMRLGGHADDHLKFNGVTSRMSLVFYVNDNYEGGDIRFNNFDMSIQPKANQLIIFPSSYLFFHRIAKVSSGERLIISNFYA